MVVLKKVMEFASGWFQSSSSTKNRRPSTRRRFGIEALESRTMLTTVLAYDDQGFADSGEPGDILILDNDMSNDPSAFIDKETITIINTPENGSVTVDLSGYVTYTSNEGFVGTDEFTYTVQDSNGAESNDGVVSVTVRPTPPPNALDDSAMAIDGQPIDIDVTANDYSTNMMLDYTTVQITSNPSHGQLSVDPFSGIITYTPDEYYVGSDSFTYTVDDDNGQVSNAASVSIDVQSDLAPTLSNFNASWDETAQKWRLTGQVQDEDLSSVVVNFGGVAIGAHSVSVNAEGTFEYYLDPDDILLDGDITAQAVDANDNVSNVDLDWVSTV